MKTILIADEQADIRRLVTMSLELEPYRLLQAGNGMQTLSMVHEHRPDLVLLDVLMPGRLDGLEVCHLLKTNDSLAGLRVVLLSASGSARDQAAGLAAGADLYLVKPFSPLHLIDQVKRLLAPQGDTHAR